MERSVAIKKLGKLLGKKFGYRIDDKSPTRDERDAAQAALTPAIEKRKTLRNAREARMKAVLEADAEYQRLKAETKAASEHVDRLSSIARCVKITVGISESMFFLVKAEGDTWEEILAKLTTERKAA